MAEASDTMVSQKLEDEKEKRSLMHDYQLVQDLYHSTIIVAYLLSLMNVSQGC